MTALPSVRIDRSDAVAVLGLVVIAGYFALPTWAVASWDYEHWMLIVLPPILLTAGALIIGSVTRHDAEPLPGLLVFALVVKLAASFVRYYVSFSLYGTGDAVR